MNSDVVLDHVKTFGEPAWDVARLFPAQGQWSEDDYFLLEARNRLVEFSHGIIEVLPMPTDQHQRIVAYLFTVLHALSQRAGGKALFASLPLRLWQGKYREPDLLYLLPEHQEWRRQQFWDGADLVMEVVSPNNRAHDTETKRREYALAGIPEYWIVDPQDETIRYRGRPEVQLLREVELLSITVLTLQGKHYVEHGAFTRGQTASSVLLAGLQVEVSAVFDTD